MRYCTSLLVSFFICLCFVNCTAQKMNSRDSNYISHADNILKTYFQDNLGKNKLLLISMGTNAYLVIIEKESNFEEYYVNAQNGKHLTSIVDKPNDTLERAFDETMYREEFTNLSSDLYKSGAEGLLTAHNSSYFVLLDKNRKKYGEYCLPIFVSPMPIDSTVYNYLFKTLIQQVNTSGISEPNGKKKSRK